MRLKHRIALTFSLITTGVLLLILGYVYLHSLNYERREFHTKLRDRVDIAVRTHLKADELSREVLNKVRTEHLRSLKGEQEFVVHVEELNAGAPLPDFIDSTFVKRVMESGEAYCHDSNELATVGVLEHDNDGDFLVFVAAENEVIIKNLTDLRNTLMALAIIYMVLVYSLGLWYAGYALNPFRRMAEHMTKAGNGNLNERLNEPEQRDEIWELAHAYNQLMDHMVTARKIQQNFISNASHELKNPLTAIIGEIDVTLQRERSNEEYREAMRVIDHEAQRLNNLTLRLLHLAETSYSSDGPWMNTVDIGQLATALVKDYGLTHPGRKIRFDLRPGRWTQLNIRGNEQMLRIAISNLIDNALKFSSCDPHLQVTGLHDSVEVSVSDSGIGIPSSDMENLFIPFFRSENARVVPGFGIGLPLVKRIVDLHGGHVQVSSDGGNTTFRLRFPH
ncbi:MAG: HAMP domain-containing histidine kinase [Flavobacteriales bacterium]|nr:HAMP domain-containing histidine kinase [Flavobacteriales bacterium]